MDVMNYVDTGYEWFSKGLELVRNILLKITSFLPGDERTILALITFIVSFLVAYKLMVKLVTHPFESRYVIYFIIITWLIFTTLFYFTI